MDLFNGVWNRVEKAWPFDGTRYRALKALEAADEHVAATNFSLSHILKHMTKAVAALSASVEASEHGKVRMYHPEADALRNLIVCIVRFAQISGVQRSLILDSFKTWAEEEERKLTAEQLPLP